MNRFLDRLAELYTPLRLRGLLMDGQYHVAPDASASHEARDPSGSSAPCARRLFGHERQALPLLAKSRRAQGALLRRIANSLHR